MQYEKETGMFLINGSLVSGNDVEDILYNHVKSAMDSAKEGVVIQTQGEHMKEALKLALEALKKVYDNVSFYGEVREAIAAIKEALAQPEQEPVEFEEWHKENYMQSLEKYGEIYKNNHVRCRHQGWLGAQSPPPQRTWVGMTEDEAIELLPEGDWEIESTLDFAQAIEAKLRSKNI